LAQDRHVRGRETETIYGGILRERILFQHLSYTTEKHYLGWIHRFIMFHDQGIAGFI
jgi:hypothetical protein